MEPIINSQLPEFKVQAFQNGNFKTVTNEDVLIKWAIFFFLPDFTFVFVQQSWSIWLRSMSSLNQWSRNLLCKLQDSHILYIKLGMTLPRLSVRSNIRCWRIPLEH